MKKEKIDEEMKKLLKKILEDDEIDLLIDIVENRGNFNIKGDE